MLISDMYSHIVIVNDWHVGRSYSKTDITGSSLNVAVAMAFEGSLLACYLVVCCQIAKIENFIGTWCVWLRLCWPRHQREHPSLYAIYFLSAWDGFY